MIGVFDGFPARAHANADYAFSVSTKRLQQAVTNALCKLNTQTCAITDVGGPSIPDCSVAFEIGIADKWDFSYLDAEEKERMLKWIGTAPLEVMDFLCVLKYCRLLENGAKKSLKSDHYMLRLRFESNLLGLQIFHERGVRHVLPEEFATFVHRRISEAFPKRVLRKVSNDSS